MKKTTSFLLLATLTAVLFSCKKNAIETEPLTLTAEEESRINAYGLSAEGAYRTDGGYIAEKDIFISKEMLNKTPEQLMTIHMGTEEHYRSTNLVTGLPRTISVRYTGGTASINSAVDVALARYNALALQIRFAKVAATAAANITISNVTAVSYDASSGFPIGGNPYNSIKVNTAISAYPGGTLATIIAHQLGHCIGFLHTDVQDPSYSCGPGAPTNHGSGVGGIHIFGTPTGPDPNSWMLACITAGQNRPFTANDKIALNAVY